MFSKKSNTVVDQKVFLNIILSIRFFYVAVIPISIVIPIPSCTYLQPFSFQHPISLLMSYILMKLP